MSYYEESPLDVLASRIQSIRDMAERAQSRMNRQIQAAQSAAVEEAQQRVAREMREQSQRINESVSRNNARINSLEQSTRRNLEALDRRQRERMSQLTQQVYEDINTVQRRLSDSISQNNARIDSLEQSTRRNIEALDRRQQERLNTVQRQLTERMNQQAQSLRGDITDLSRRVDRRFSSVEGQIKILSQGMEEMANEINRRFERNEQEMAGMQSEIDDIYARFANEDEQAQAARQTAIALMEVVEQRTQLDRFAPGYEAGDLRRAIETLAHSPEHGAVLKSQANAAILKIWEVESHAIQEKAKHDALVEIALTQVEKVLTVVNENRVMEEPVEGGDPMEIENEFWSEGEFGQLEQELKGLEAELGDRYNRNLTKERVEEITLRSQEIEARILQIGAESVRKAILSEARVETAEDIVNAMQSKGWTLKGMGTDKPEFNYMGGIVDHDWRQGVCAVLENNLGEEITVIVDPDTDTQNRLILHQETSPSGMTDRKVREQMQSIQAQMRDLGYQVGESTSSVTHIPQMGSVERLGKAHATEQIRKKLQH